METRLLLQMANYAHLTTMYTAKQDCLLEKHKQSFQSYRAWT